MASLPSIPSLGKNNSGTSTNSTIIIGGNSNGDSKNVEPMTIESTDNSYVELLSEQLDKLDPNFENSNNTINLLIELYSIKQDDEDAEEKFKVIYDKLVNIKKGDVPIETSRIFELQYKFEHLYRDNLSKLKGLQDETFKQYSKSFPSLYEESIKTEKIRDLERTMVNIKPIELEGEERLDLDLSKEEAMNILKLEKKKRAKLSFENEQIYTPEISKLNRKYERWGINDNELKRFLTNDIDAMNRKVQLVKRTEDL